MSRINTNTMAISALNMYRKNISAMEKSMKRLSSGLRINSAADDASGLAISEKMRSQIRGLKQAQSNAYDAISFLQTGEGALQQTSDILQRMKELTIKAQNTGVLTEDDRVAIDIEMNSLRDEIDRIASSTTFNGKKILDGSFSDGSPATFHVGASAEDYDKISVTINDMSSKGLSEDGTTKFSIDLSTPEASNQTLEAIDSALSKVSNQRAVMGAVQNRLEYTIDNLSTTEENLTAAESRIRDVDIAEEMLEYTKHAMLAQVALTLLSQASKQPSAILTLLQNL